MCGWRRDVEDIILVLDSQVLRGSTLHILCALPVDERERAGARAASRSTSSRTARRPPRRQRGRAHARRAAHPDLRLGAHPRRPDARDADARLRRAANLATLLLIRDLRYEGLARRAAPATRAARPASAARAAPAPARRPPMSASGGSFDFGGARLQLRRRAPPTSSTPGRWARRRPTPSSSRSRPTTPGLSNGGRISKLSMQRTMNKLEPKEASLSHLRAESPLKVTIARSFAQVAEEALVARRRGAPRTTRRGSRSPAAAAAARAARRRRTRPSRSTPA